MSHYIKVKAGAAPTAPGPKICRTCVHFVGGGIVSGLETCKMFAKIDAVTGKTKHEYAEFARADEDQCGLEGRCHEHLPPSRRWLWFLPLTL